MRFFSFFFIIILFGVFHSYAQKENNVLQMTDTAAIKKAMEKANPPMQVADRAVVSDSFKTYKQNPKSTVFGSSFFNTPSLSFEPNLRIATPLNYILGPDDELILSISGYQEANIRVQVRPEGSIIIPQVGEMLVSGLSILDATNKIKTKMQQTAYPTLGNGSTQLNITLGKIRSIRITIIGAAKSGNYTVSSLTSVFNSLYLCGGPDAINTYREIQLIRNNKVYQKIDLYQFLTKGDQRGNVLLKENDVINFPVYKKRVTLAGEVKRPGVFEMLENESLDNLLFYAGGFTENAFKASIKIKQVTDTGLQLKDLNKSDFATYKLVNGDSLTVNKILNKIENIVSIDGAVYRPGEFEFTSELTVKELIRKASGLQEGSYLDRAIITRTHPDRSKENISFSVKDIMLEGKSDIKMQKGDRVQIAFISDFVSKYTIQIEGEIRKPGIYPYKNNITLKDMLFLADGITDAASTYRIEIGRRIVKENVIPNDSIAEVIILDVDKNLGITDERMILKPFDLITVRRNPGYLEQKRVKIIGEVVYPGSYTIISKKERLSDLLKRAGGLTPYAYSEGLFLIRKNNFNDMTDSISTNEKITRQILKDTNNLVLKDVKHVNSKIAINIKKILEKPGSVEDYVLEEGDLIQVVKLDPLVKLSGEVLLATKTSFVDGKPLSYYLGKAGGTTDEAKLSRIYVLNANGSVNKTHNYLWGLFRSYPKVQAGAEIIIPNKKISKELGANEVISLASTFVSLASLVIITISTLAK
jgi:protein involved in polysaccharide export with SLBB domain